MRSKYERGKKKKKQKNPTLMYPNYQAGKMGRIFASKTWPHRENRKTLERNGSWPGAGRAVTGSQK